jgi:glucose dehydrogenase
VAHGRTRLRIDALQPLDLITTRNVHQLKLAFSFRIGTNRGAEAAPIVVGSTMYVVTPFPDYVYALDLSRPGAHVKWKYDPKPKASAQGVACCDTVNRGVVYSNGVMDGVGGRHRLPRGRARHRRLLAPQPGKKSDTFSGGALPRRAGRKGI